MTGVIWKYAGPMVSEERIRTLERDIGMSFPSDYKSFIAERDGARPVPNAVLLPDGGEIIMERLLRMEAGGKDSLASGAEALKKRGQRLVPFGSDPFGNLFCFRYLNNEVMAVVFWNHETNSSTVVCNTFSELLESLHEAK